MKRKTFEQKKGFISIRESWSLLESILGWKSSNYNLGNMGIWKKGINTDEKYEHEDSLKKYSTMTKAVKNSSTLTPTQNLRDGLPVFYLLKN